MTLTEILGPAAIPTLICLIVGIVMLVLEMFMPGFGVAGIVGLLSLAAVVVMQIGWGSPQIGVLVVAIVMVIIILALLWLIRSFQKGGLGRSRLVLQDHIDASSSPVTTDDRTLLVGKRGVAITPLRPAGIAEIDGRRVSVTTTGAFVESGKPIEVIDLKGFDILVQEAAEQQL